MLEAVEVVAKVVFGSLVYGALIAMLLFLGFVVVCFFRDCVAEAYRTVLAWLSRAGRDADQTVAQREKVTGTVQRM